MVRPCHSVWRWFGGCVLTAACLAGPSRAAEILVDELPVVIWKENVEIYAGDTVTWTVPRSATNYLADTESYTGEWKSPILRAGESFSHTFTTPGRYAYRIGWYTRPERPSFVRNGLGTVTVRPLVGPRPAVSIVTPPDGFLFQFDLSLEAVVTNSAASVQAVHFFAGDRLLGTATNAPYRLYTGFGDNPGVYELTAVAVDRAGNTNSSPPVRLRFAERGAYLFAPMRLPRGQFLFHYVADHRQPWVYWSEDLKTWRPFSVSLNSSTVLDLGRAVTNLLSGRRIYTIVPGPL